PDGPDIAGDLLHAVGAGWRGAAQRRAAAGAVGAVVVAGRERLDPLPTPDPDVPIGAGERAVEGVGEDLGDGQRAVGVDLDVDLGVGDPGGAGERGQGRVGQGGQDGDNGEELALDP